MTTLRPIEDDFMGDNTALKDSIRALIALNDDNALVPHGIGGHARGLLAAACIRLQEGPAETTTAAAPFPGVRPVSVREVKTTVVRWEYMHDGEHRHYVEVWMDGALLASRDHSVGMTGANIKPCQQV